MATDLKDAHQPAAPLPSWVTPPNDGGAPPVRDLSGSPPVRYREIAAVLGTVLLFDLWIYRGSGYSGYAAFFLAACALFLFGSPERFRRGATALVGVMALLLAARLVWLGSPWLAVLGFALLVAFAMAATGRRPYVLDLALHAFQSTFAGVAALLGYGRAIDRRGLTVPRSGWLNVLLPVATVLLFGTVFVFANPDVVAAVSRGFMRFWTGLTEALARFSPSATEIILWWIVGTIAAGLLRPLIRTHVLAPLSRAAQTDPTAAEPLFESPYYAAYRNTLVAVIALFAGYLAFEFRTLWFREFPQGFYYSGYAHEGAAWLTVALAMTIFVLSAIFRESTRQDPRLPRLRRLAFAWSALNFLLAVAVYHRLFIYIDFNGMTRMRTVGLFGISTVVVGFLLVVLKIARDRDFAWLIERELWTLAFAIFLWSITPIDPLVHSYNVRRIRAGDPAPAVQISVHPIDSGGLLVLPPLLESDNEIIREGVRALLTEADAERRDRLASSDWTGYQLADRLLDGKLAALRDDLRPYDEPAARQAARKRFDDYAYQWY